jgi:flagellar FliL protein
MKLFLALGLLGLMTVAQPAFAGDDKKDDDKGAQNYVYLKPVMIPVMGLNGTVDQFISITVTLEFDDSATADKERAISPRIVDAYLQDLYGAVDDHKVMKGGVLDPMALKAELESSNTRILGGIHCNVLLQNIGQRSLRGGERPSAS